jgi:hypothetical protein
MFISNRLGCQGSEISSRQRRDNRGNGVVEGVDSGKVPRPLPTEGRGSVVSSPSGVQRGAPADNDFWYVQSLKKGACGTQKMIIILATCLLAFNFCV